MGQAVELDDLLEKEWDAQLFGSKKGLATTLGWTLTYHTLRSKGSASGFCDRVLVRERVIFAELKTQAGKPTDRQCEWLDGLSAAGGECYLWRPSDLDEIGKILGKRWIFFPHGSSQTLPTPSLAQATGVPWWQPDSLWIPHVGRRDASQASPPSAQMALAE